MLSKNLQPGLAPLDRTLLKAIPTFATLKTGGATVQEITAAFKGWGSAVGSKLITAALQTLVTDPVIEIVRPVNADLTPTPTHGLEAANTLGVSNDTALKEMLTVREVAKYLGCSYGEARNRMLDGRIRAVKDGRWCRSRREWVEEYIEKQTVRAEPPPAEVPALVPKRRTAVGVKANGVAHRFLQNRKG
jgi:excisionase family DNA binding protein